MKTKQFFLLACVAATITSCASYTSSSPVMSVGGTNINTYVEADIDYANVKKVEAEVTSKKLFGIISLTRNGNKQFTPTNRYRGLSKPERQALYRVREMSGCDIILEPEFSEEKHSWFFGAYKTSQVKIQGWGANIRGMKEDKHFGSSK